MMNTTSGEEESEEEWEDVLQGTSNPSSPGSALLQSCAQDEENKGSLEIVVASGNLKDKGKSKLILDDIRRALAAAERKAWLQVHQVNLLTLIARGMCLSKLCSDHTLQALVMSHLAADAPGLVLESPSNYTKGMLVRLVKWLSLEGNRLLSDILKEVANLRDSDDPDVAGNWRDLLTVSKVMLTVSLLRVLGLRARLVTVLGPLKPLKPPSSLFRESGKAGKGEKGCGKKVGIGGTSDGGGDCGRGPGGSECASEGKANIVSGGGGSGTAISSGGEGLGARLLKFNIEHEQKTKASHAEKQGEEKVKEETENKKKRRRSERVEGTVSQVTKGKGSKGKRRSCPASGRSSARGGRSSARDRRASPRESTSNDLSSGEDFDPDSLKRKKRQIKHVAPSVKKMKFSRAKRASSRAVEVIDEDGDEAKEGCMTEEVELVDVEETGSWAEVYVSGMKRWVCLHLTSCSVDQPKLCEKHSILPLHYVVAFEHQNNSSAYGYVTDVTARYASDWCTSTRKHRVDESWWAESLQPYRPHNMIEVMEENEDIAARLSSKSLPLSITDYKNHPLYVLRRHLLKFEALYPKDCEVLGYCKREAVYSRKNVHMLHTRETWLKEGRMVRRGEEPYGIVKARPKRGQTSGDELTSEVFGRWQTEEYTPPIVVEGKIPRNEYGNVDMYKSSMLPVGAVHLKGVGVAKVARKLGIDSAPAVVGFDFHGGHSYPILDGVIVPEESAELLLDAWETERQIAMEKDKSKQEKRVLGHWRRLARAVLIRHRVQEQFDTINS